MNILLFGKSGQIGWELQRSLSLLGNVIALDQSGEGNLCGDLTDLAGLSRTVRDIHPEIIVNAAAYTAVDKAETETEAVRLINANALACLADEAKKRNAWLLHYSTDYVFDGSGETPWKETDTPAPLNVYGQTKLDGEKTIQASGCRHIILRTSWVYAARGNNFVKTMLRLAGERETLNVIDDQIGAPTGAELLADTTAHVLKHLRHVQNAPSLSGIYHLTATGETSWHGFARFIVEETIKLGTTLKTTPSRILPIPATAYPTPAKRPHNSRLDTALFRKTFGLQLPHWQKGVSRMLAEILAR